MRNFPRRLAVAVVTGAALLSTLSGCVPLMMGSAALASSVAMDRRSAGAQMDDQAIQIKANRALEHTLDGPSYVSLNSYNRRVLITGEVASEADKERVSQIVMGVENVMGVYNELVIAPPSSLSDRSYDTWISGKVRAAIFATKHLPSKALTVTTARGVVYLQGLVSQQEAQEATNAARSVDGVEKVVSLFEIISDQEARRLSPAPPPYKVGPAAGDGKSI